jgi:catechol 2,3-dioxygenase-like lactoylglutathione lyase family enzyme
MIDHSGVIVSDFPRSKAFYSAALGAIGIARCEGISRLGNRQHRCCGLRRAGSFRSRAESGILARPRPGPIPVHIAFRVSSRALVDAFYHVAIGAGGRDNGAPGLRPQYHPNYYGAFVLDPDGPNIEAVCRGPARAFTRHI